VLATELAAPAQDAGALGACVIAGGAWLFACATKLLFAGVLAGQRAVMPPTQRSSSFARS
jgi:hypothetical protein